MKRKTRPIKDLILLPFVYFAAVIMRVVANSGVKRLPLSKNALLQLGVFPIRNHYYQPQFDYRGVDDDFSKERELPGIDLNVEGQLNYLQQLKCADELKNLPLHKTAEAEFYLYNGGFEAGDAEIWYQVLRDVKPRKVIEIGGGFSTLIGLQAVNKNQQENPAHQCEYICVEPYEMPWLEKTGVTIIRKKVEDMSLEVFAELEAGDILFVDSSHIIRPRGDVLFEFLQIIPALKPGVIVHVHDIFTPRNYPLRWLKNNVKFWNEQYLLEAFLSNNHDWEIMAALNFLHHNHPEALKSVCPNLAPTNDPGSFYMRRIK